MKAILITILICLVIPKVSFSDDIIENSNAFEPKQLMPEFIQKIPVLIEVPIDEKTQIQGTGFFLTKNQKVYFLTAKHVLEDSKYPLGASTIILTAYSTQKGFLNQIHWRLDYKKLKQNNLVLFNKEDKDVVAIEVARGTPPKLNDGILSDQKNGDLVSSVPDNVIKMYKDVLISNDVYLLGYPTSLGLIKNPSLDLTRPLLRKGIVAGLNDSSKTIILDCFAFGGNSGGPVFQVEHTPNMIPDYPKFYLIGLVTQYVPYVDPYKSLQNDLEMMIFAENSGYSIVEPMDSIYEMLP